MKTPAIEAITKTLPPGDWRLIALPDGQLLAYTTDLKNIRAITEDTWQSHLPVT